MNQPTITLESATIDSAPALEQALHSLIPISADMGVTVDSYDGTTLVIRAPLSNNINHQQSAFGGSLFSLTAMAGWGMLQLKLCELKIAANTVVAGGEVNYALPVFEELICRCALPDNYPEFVARLENKGKASITLSADIILQNQAAMSFSGRYVVIQNAIK
ncbi:MAG: thioesterase domain-containing protein [Pseudomonadales bacterium]|nr:thioesterase domain-containing protein [Pseudomonadales bacterium]